MARNHTHLHYSDTKGELTEYKDARHGAVEDALWDEDELVDHRPRSKKKRKPRKRGCPENDGKQHVYVWVDWPDDDYAPPWYIRNREIVFEVNICCGCGKRGPGRSFRRKQ